MALGWVPERDARERLCEAVQEGLLNPDMFVVMVAKWMTNDDIIEMMDANEINLRDLTGY
jgi:hypothetical protein|tara:strand:+ start:190 stop:369 length:180 start_codon:yes stop_codon:yes gene_type:complete